MARKMKDSGIEWIGQIPENWEIVKFKLCADVIMGQSPDGNDIKNEGTVLFMQGNREFGEKYPNPTLYCDTCNKHSRIGDILMSVRAPVGAINESDRVYGIGRGLCSIKAENINNGFLKYYLKKSVDDLKYYSNGSTFEAITVEILENFRIVIPTEMEQQKIADFLDDKVGEIDAIISKTKQSIEDYKRYKQAVITEAITQGLDKSVTIIDTGNVHIPKVPAHWKMKKIKYIFEIKKDIAGKEGYDILSITQKGIKVKDISKNEGQLAQDYSNYQLVDIGDFAMNHMDLLTGWVDISKYAGVTSPDYRVFRFIDKTGYDADYYLYLMQMCYMNKIFYGLGQGVSNLGRWRLQADKFLNFSIPEPPLAEQQEIAKYLSARCGEIDALIAKKEAFVEEMENYKKSLIYEYVTGKKEVL